MSIYKKKKENIHIFNSLFLHTNIYVYIYIYINYDYQIESISLRLSVIGKISGITEWWVNNERSVGNCFSVPLIR
jgi:hypothetical protein